MPPAANLGTLRLDCEYEIEPLRVRVSNFKLVLFPEPSLFMLVLGRESSS